MKQRESQLDDRIHSFIAGKAPKSLSVSVADWFYGKFGERDSSVQTNDPIVGMKYEAASRGKY